MACASNAFPVPVSPRRTTGTSELAGGELDSKLLAREVKIKAALRHQLIVVAGLRDLSFLQHDDRVRLADRAQPMRDHDPGAAGA